MVKTLSKRVLEACKQLTRHECEEIMTGLDMPFYPAEPTKSLQLCIYSCVIAGELHPRDVFDKL